MTFTKMLTTHRLACRAALLTAIVTLAACDDPNAIDATLPTATTSVTVYALTGTGSELPSGYSVPAGQAVRLDGTLLFDIAFDIDAQGAVVMYQMELVVWPRVGIHRVGLHKSAQPYDAITRAPSEGYIFEEPVVAQEGDAIVVETHDQRVCGFPFSPRLYTKFELDDVNLTTRAIRLRITQNPNCGFRSFLAGIPAD